VGYLQAPHIRQQVLFLLVVLAQCLINSRCYFTPITDTIVVHSALYCLPNIQREMKTIELGSHSITVFNSITELNIERYNQLNIYILKDSAIGATAQDISEKFTKMFQLIRQKDMEGLQIEAANIVYSLNAILESTNYNHYSFLCFVKEIDGKPIGDITNEQYCRQILTEIGTWLTVGAVAEIGSDVKKKINKELSLFFPEKYSSVNELMYFQQLKRKVEIQLRRLILRKPSFLDEQMLSVEKYFLSLDAPKQMRPVKGNAIVEQMQYFELLCTLLEENNVHRPKELTVFEFMSRINHLEKKFKNSKNGN
jgi:hypothetical protein